MLLSCKYSIPMSWLPCVALLIWWLPIRSRAVPDDRCFYFQAAPGNSCCQPIEFLLLRQSYVVGDLLRRPEVTHAVLESIGTVGMRPRPEPLS